MITRLFQTYINSEFSFFIPENSDLTNNINQSLLNLVNNYYPHVERYSNTYPITNENQSTTIQFITYADNESMYITRNLDQNNNYLLVKSNLLNLYHLLKNNLLSQILDNTLVTYYNSFHYNIMNNHDYNKLIRRFPAKTKIYCPLLMDYIEKGRMVAKTSCNHEFSSKELRKWLIGNESSTHCPLCKHNLYENF